MLASKLGQGCALPPPSPTPPPQPQTPRVHAQHPHTHPTPYSGTLTASPDADFTVKVDVKGLQPNTTYYYAFRQGQIELALRLAVLLWGWLCDLTLLACLHKSVDHRSPVVRLLGRWLIESTWGCLYLLSCREVLQPPGNDQDFATPGWVSCAVRAAALRATAECSCKSATFSPLLSQLASGRTYNPNTPSCSPMQQCPALLRRCFTST